MANEGLLRLPFGDGEYAFNVARLGERLELESKTGYATTHSYRRMRLGEAGFTEVRETIRIGLIGGGTAPEVAFKLVQRYVDDMPRAENLLLAQAILIAEITGAPAEPVGGEAKKKPPTDPAAVAASTVTTAG